MMRLVEALDANDGVVSVVGAGGKKSTMYRLAEELDSPLLTSTVRIPIFDPHVARVLVTEDPVGEFSREPSLEWPLGVVPAREGSDRYRGYDPSVVDALATLETVQTVLVKADGARMRKFKAPGEHEPRIPASSTVVVPVVSAHVIGESLDDERVHRVEQVCRLTGLTPGEPLTPSAIAAIIVSEEGGRKDVPVDAHVIPVINMVDDCEREWRAREVATEILDRGAIDRVVLTRLTAEAPVVDVLERD